MSRRNFGSRINAWLAEAPGEIFKSGKWRFWFPTLIGLTALNARRRVDEFPEELDAEERAEPRAGRLKNSTTHVSSKNQRHSASKRTTQTDAEEGLKRLRETLKLISFHHPGQHFKADVKDDCVWIRSMTSDHGIQRTQTAAKASLQILSDAVSMPPKTFRHWLEDFLRREGFEI